MKRQFRGISRMTAVKFSICAAIVTLILWGNRRSASYIKLGHIEISLTERDLKVQVTTDKLSLEGAVGLGIPDTLQAESCDTEVGSSSNSACATWPGVVQLSVKLQDTSTKNGACYRIKWQSLTADYTPKDCFKITTGYWYGGPELYRQHWPVNNGDIPMQQFGSFDYLMNEQMHTKFGPIAEPYWFNSHGAAILVDDHVPLHAGINENEDGRLCLAANTEGTVTAKYKDYKSPELSYMICQGHDAKDVHQLMASRFIDHPIHLPDERALRSPIWSTWARYKTQVNQTNVLQYADEIEKYKFPHSQIELDDMYTTTYGDFDFNTKKFPDARKMVNDLHDRGFRVTSWVTPFANIDSAAFIEGMKRGFWIKDSKGTVPGLVKWWQGTGAVLDTTNSEAVDWFVGRLETVRKEIGMDSFKFDAGELGHLPAYVGTDIVLNNPNQYTTYYASLVAKFGGMAEMRAGYKSMRHPILFRMMDKDSWWGPDNGLQTLIPTALVMSMSGYHYILPDMIGGNGYSPDNPFNTVTPPDKELFVRWVELCAYLPAMQFSFTPWQYDQEVIDISATMVRVHEERVTPVILKAAKEMIKTGTPIIRPIWWIDPNDKDALESDSSFLVGNEILVAPVVQKGARARDIYLPKGQWKDDINNKRMLGGRWIYQYAAGLGDIPTFTYLGE